MKNTKKSINNNIEQNEIILKYKTNFINNKLKIFGERFVKNNKKNCKIITDKKEYNLISHLEKNESNSNNNILEIKLKIIKPLINMKEMFSNCESLISFDDNNLNTSNVTDISYMFYECHNLSELSDISKWDTSKINDMSNLFKGCQLLINIPDISKWDTSKVNDMSSMFGECSSLLKLPDISKWNIKNVTDISSMFEGCSSLSYFPDISIWNTSNINYMSDMFKGCFSLSSLSDISKWDISNLAFINNIFRGCLSLPKKDNDDRQFRLIEHYNNKQSQN